jgi:hypothetical protein
MRDPRFNLAKSRAAGAGLREKALRLGSAGYFLGFFFRRSVAHPGLITC